MEAIILLKQEINQTTDTLHDFDKWKLIVASALAAAALGLTPGGHDHYSLVLLIPYACAYVDLNSYQHLIRIAVIARFLREHRGSGGDGLLQLYECQCEELRRKYGVFGLGINAQFGASLGLSIVAPIWALFSFAGQKTLRAVWESLPTSFRCTSVGLWMGGLFLVSGLWWHYRRKDKVAREEPLKDEALLAEFNGPLGLV